MTYNAKPRNDEALREQGDEGKQNKLNPHDTSAENQCAIAYAALLTGRQSTADLRHTHGIMHPGGRINDLRNAGHKIDTVRVSIQTPDGITHRKVAMYVLQPRGDA
ncbi:hypothetical protein CAP31_03260 [Sulfuriferula sp. AH1]|uniref:helix-turn-helix domain-containing protein n=1 Tax=Sulfuriferula sp. AH1 TaxID=1985873 RepID=UPI000B3B5F67|nr:helix-turn-helix domain-containing protein [Sulfuriferula sp. AH1]ARU30789.1 hypothetical protein CAP31_03260 [Sulfuriferula sp. AH1]